MAIRDRQEVRHVSREQARREVRDWLASDQGLDAADASLQVIFRLGLTPELMRMDVRMRDAALRGMFIDAVYENGTMVGTRADGTEGPILVAENQLRRAGFDDVTMLNMGPLSVGRSVSNHQATLVVVPSALPDEQTQIVLAFRGTKDDPEAWRDDLPGADRDYFSDIEGHARGAFDYATGNTIRSYQRSAERFWEGAGDIIMERIIREIETDPENLPRIIITGHSYGADAAARVSEMVALNLREHYAGRDDIDIDAIVANIEYVGFGSTRGLTGREERRIEAAIGSASRYVGERDTIVNGLIGRINPARMGSLGDENEIEVNGDHNQYAAALFQDALVAEFERREPLEDVGWLQAIYQGIVNGERVITPVSDMARDMGEGWIEARDQREEPSAVDPAIQAAYQRYLNGDIPQDAEPESGQLNASYVAVAPELSGESVRHI